MTASKANENVNVERVMRVVSNGSYAKEKRLRACQARVLINDRWYVLRSYRTIIAAIDRETGEGYDFLRKAYGYTATSCQHVRKFMQDYEAKSVHIWRA